jgi:hypothetical protein
VTRRLVVVLACLAVLVIGGCARDEPRAAGITERWLTAVGDQGRDNLRSKSVRRASEYGDQAVVTKVVPTNAENDERTFSDFEVGKAIESGGTARVPFRLTARLEGGDTEEREGTAVLARDGQGWRVVDVTGRAPGERAPSEGGERPSSASAGQWIAAAILGVVVAVASAILIARQPESTTGASPA